MKAGARLRVDAERDLAARAAGAVGQRRQIEEVAGRGLTSRLHDDAEFISTQTGNGVGLSQRLACPASHLTNGRIAGTVAMVAARPLWGLSVGHNRLAQTL